MEQERRRDRSARTPARIAACTRARAASGLGVVILVALLAAAVFLLVGARSDAAAARTSSRRSSTKVAVGDSTGNSVRGSARASIHAAPSLHGTPGHSSSRARTVVFGVLVLASVLGASVSKHVRVARCGRPLALGIVGLPFGRAPPRLRIA